MYVYALLGHYAVHQKSTHVTTALQLKKKKRGLQRRQDLREEPCFNESKKEHSEGSTDRKVQMTKGPEFQRHSGKRAGVRMKMYRNSW